MTSPPPGRTDAELAALDVPALLRFGLPLDGPRRRALFADGAVAAALAAEECEVPPHAVAFLSEVVRAAGLRAAAGLPEPLVGPGAADLADDWLHAAGSVLDPDDVAAGELVADWLAAVAALLEARHVSRRA
ncbi:MULTISPECIES: hypothetical protein [Kitasatospora]|uniref:Uncharacterized protein n=1 Tax=Kitasatospora setae (strain ATCC 33774 / DSM 43861 / JCM 3304 / KCC A-0304 / NBRC 14216 / KM-6054) TaxID=452652 RepID=E4NAZ4_KITSK|nr:MULTISPECIES: hypothetical protein [Kitasatospora]BAJ28375.1 hypothetical protein KSE_25620 [Kitasatospora setae KM-6054]